MRKTLNFTLLDRTFTVSSLDPMTSLRALKHVSGVLVPIFSAAAAGATETTQMLTTAIGGLEQLPQLADIFRKVCKVEWEGKTLDLDPFFADVFTGRPALLIAWLVECVKFEFGDFLEESGRSLLAGTVSGFGSLVGSLGKSGES